MPNQAYRLRIRNAADSGNALIISSIRTDTNPYIASVPTGDGQEVDLLTGAVRTGAYVIEVVDAIVGTDVTGTRRILTEQLYSSSGNGALPQLLSRKAFIEVSTDGGANWNIVWTAGYITNVRQVDAIRYAITVSNTRRVEQTKQIFTWSAALERDKFPQRGCVFGGPIIDGFGVGGDKTVDTKGWEFKFLGSSGSLSTPKGGDILAFEYVAGYFAPSWERKKVPGPGQATDFYNNILPFRELLPGDKSVVGDTFKPLNTADVVPAYPRLLAVIQNGSDTFYGSIRMLFSNTGDVFQPPAGGAQVDRWPFQSGGYSARLFVTLDQYNPDDISQAWPALPTANTIVKVRGVTRQVDEMSPVYVDLHPVEIAKRLYELIGITVNSASVDTVRNAIGPNTRLALRITKPETMAQFLESTLFGPFGFAARVNDANEVQFFVTRMLEAVPPTLTIADIDVVGDTPPAIYDLDESTVVTSFVVEQQTFSRWAEVDGNNQTPPPDGIRITPQAVQFDNADTTTFSTRVVQYSLPGMVRDVATFVPNLQNFAIDIAREGFGRFGRGAPSMEVQVLRTSAAAAAQVGDLVYLNVGYFPNKNYRIGESSVGARVAQVVRREERPEGPMFKLVDAGIYAQPAVAPTISIAASTADPRRIAQFTITNAATLNSTADVSLAVEWATGVSAPASGEHGVRFIRYQPLNIPTFAIQLPPVTPGTKVHVRARTEQAGYFPSAWTGWQSVTLDAWSTPASVTVPAGTITNASAIVNWGLGSPANTTDAIDVFVAPGSTAPSNWQGYRVNTLTAGTTTTQLINLSPSTAYIVGVAFRDVINDTRGTIVTQTFTTAATATVTADRPAGFAIINGVNDASLPQGVALGLWAAQGAADIVIERAPNTRPFATDLPGTYTELAVVSATTEVYVDYVPNDGTKYWYRIRHRASGKLDSEFIPRFASGLGYATPSGLMATATGVPATLSRPSGVEAVITPESSWEAWAPGTPLFNGLVVKLYKTDPQNRAQYVQYRFRSRTGTTWGSWDETSWNNENYIVATSDYYYTKADSLDDTKTYQLEWRIYGADNQGNMGYIRSGTTEYPLNYGVNTAIIKVQKQGFNSSTNKYETWWRYYFQRGNNTLDEDGSDNINQSFTTQVIAATVKNQDGTTATGVTTSGTKTSDGWYAYWNSAATDNWVYEVSVDTAIPEQSYIQYQNTDVLDNQLVATTYGQTFIGPASQTAAGAVDWSDITNIPTSVESLIEVVWGTPSAESSNAIEVQGVCYDINNSVYTTNMVYATVVVTDGAADAEPSSTATIDAASTPVGTVVAGAGTATAVFKTNASGQFKIKVTETAAASRYIWVRSGGHQQVYVRARDGILQLIYS